MKRNLWVGIVTMGLMLIISCRNDVGSLKVTKPHAMGVINEIVVIADKEVFEGPVGDTIRYYYSSSFPILPTPEPLFDLRHFTVEDLTIEPLRRELRTYMIVADLDDMDSPATQMLRKDLGEDRFMKAKAGGEVNSSLGRDKWARGQLLFYLFARGESGLANAVKDNFNTIAQRVNAHDENSISANIYTARRVNLGLKEEMTKRYGLEIEIPGDYDIVLDDKEEDFLWLRKNAREAVLNFVFTTETYSDTSQLSVAHMIKNRDQYGKQYVSSEVEGSYMRTNVEDLPIFDYDIEVDGQFAREIRGVWELENDFKGGPFVSYAIPVNGKVIYIDAFILGPGAKKRNLMQQLDYIIKHSKITPSL
jgi:hypothetical protein